MIVIKNANLQSMADIENQICDIAIDNGIITAIGDIDTYNCDNVQIIDAKGKLVTPGLIDGHCHIGICEEGTADAGEDCNEMINPITPHVRAIDGIKPQDIAFGEALQAGFTTVVTGPGSGNVIGGTFCALKTVGKTVWDMCLKEEVCMKMALGENPKRVYGTKDKMPMTRMGSASLMREALTKAKIYHDKKAKYLAGEPGAKEPSYDASMASLSRVFDGMTVKIHAHQQDDIVTAMRIGEEFGLNFTVDHCTEGYIIADELKAHNQRIIIGPTLSSRSKIELQNMTFDGGKVYEDKGIEFAIMTDHPVIPLSCSLAQAGIYAKHGVSHRTIMRALTINPAKFTGIADRVGSIEVGKDADIVIWSGDPLHYMTTPDVVLVNGKVVISK